MSTDRDNWVVIRAGPNYRVYNTVTCDYHRGTNGAVRVYADHDPAQRRANTLNGGSTAPNPETDEAPEANP